MWPFRRKPADLSNLEPKKLPASVDLLLKDLRKSLVDKVDKDIREFEKKLLEILNK